MFIAITSTRLSSNDCMPSTGERQAGGQGASGSRAHREGHRDDGEGPGGAEKKRPGDHSAATDGGQHPLPTGEEPH